MNGNFGGGDGSNISPYLVEDADDLNAVRNKLGGHYKQVADIDLSKYSNWVPIGDEKSPFVGVYDGGMHTISNLSINNSGKHIGLFGYSKKSTINGVRVISGSVNGLGSYNYVGAILGRGEDLVLTDCSNEGCSIFGIYWVGGVFGVSYRCTCKRLKNFAPVSDDGKSSNTSLLSGIGSTEYNDNGYCVEDSYNTGTIYGYNVHGIGYGESERCYNSGDLYYRWKARGISEKKAKSCFALIDHIYRLEGSTSTSDVCRISYTTPENSYALDSMKLIYL